MDKAQSRQKSYANKRKRDLVFTIGDKVFLRVSPVKGVMRFGKRGKLSPRFIGPYEVLDRVGAVAYHLALPPELYFIHPVFHLSMLRKCISDSSQYREESNQHEPKIRELTEKRNSFKLLSEQCDGEAKCLRAELEVAWKEHANLVEQLNSAVYRENLAKEFETAKMEAKVVKVDADEMVDAYKADA
uniref:Uncharacterized protein LOC104217731 n=1 Tax=Nicotiana sylvestris TaxID=4096 RepID=A0A1U7VJ48_NICSY|nr:PREDICTED: uncharacterized protein LOC104217731 [Nicotiana sylvestris]